MDYNNMHIQDFLFGDLRSDINKVMIHLNTKEKSIDANKSGHNGSMRHTFQGNHISDPYKGTRRSTL